VIELVFKWLNRRSQRQSFTWKKFLNGWQGSWQIPRPRIVEDWKNPSTDQPEMRLV